MLLGNSRFPEYNWSIFLLLGLSKYTKKFGSLPKLVTDASDPLAVGPFAQLAQAGQLGQAGQLAQAGQLGQAATLGPLSTLVKELGTFSDVTDNGLLLGTRKGSEHFSMPIENSSPPDFNFGDKRKVSIVKLLHEEALRMKEEKVHKSKDLFSLL